MNFAPNSLKTVDKEIGQLVLQQRPEACWNGWWFAVANTILSLFFTSFSDSFNPHVALRITQHIQPSFLE